jgi:hypothetical protein
MRAETVLILVRAALLAIGTLAVQRGWISASQAHAVTGPAAGWIAAGIVTVAPTLAGSWWGRQRAAAIALLRHLLPPGVPLAAAEAVLRQLGWRVVVQLARHYHLKLSAEDQVKFAGAIPSLQEAFANVCFGRGGEVK